MQNCNMVDSIGGAKTQYRYAAPGRYTGQPSLVNQPQLCDECNKNQATKIQQLNSFEPSRECDFQTELDTHKQQLDERYKLCPTCHETVEHHLNVQAMDLKTFLLSSHLQQSKSTPTKLLRRSSSPESIFLVFAQLTCVFLATLLVCSDSTPANHNNCSEALSLWNIKSVAVDPEFWSSFPSANMTTASKYLVFHLTKLFQVAASSCWEKSLQLMLCLCSLAKRKYLHISLGSLLINILIFLKRKSRFGILILISWTLLSVSRFWETFWLKAATGWHVTVAVFCCILGLCSLLFSLLSYSRVLGTREKKRCQFTPSPSNVEIYRASSHGMGTSTSTESSPSRHKTSTELDHNLNGLSLGLPTARRNGYKTLLSAGNSGRTGFFWSQSFSNNLKETPLVSMHQRPLIVPATLHFSGLRERSPASQTQETTTVPRSAGSSYRCSSDEDSGSVSDAMGVNSVQKSRALNDKQSKGRPRKTKRQTSSQTSKTKLIYPKPRSLLLLASLLFNAYFIVSFTDWPSRVLHSLWNTLKIQK